MLQKCERRIKKQLRMRLKLHLDKDFKLSKFHGPREVIDFLSKCHQRIQWSADPNEYIVPPILEKNSIKRLNWKDYFYFIHNIPSEYFRIKNPKKA